MTYQEISKRSPTNHGTERISERVWTILVVHVIVAIRGNVSLQLRDGRGETISKRMICLQCDFDNNVHGHTGDKLLDTEDGTGTLPQLSTKHLNVVHDDWDQILDVS